MAKVYSFGEYGFGELTESSIDGVNIPVNIIILNSEKYSDFKYYHQKEIKTTKEKIEGISDDMMIWILEADNFMPRKEHIVENAYLFMSTDRKSLEEVVQKYITPLYEIALNNLKTISENYYWHK